MDARLGIPRALTAAAATTVSLRGRHARIDFPRRPPRPFRFAQLAAARSSGGSPSPWSARNRSRTRSTRAALTVSTA